MRRSIEYIHYKRRAAQKVHWWKNELEFIHELTFFQWHPIFHDTYGRVYDEYGVDRGQCYALKYSSDCMKKNPVLGNVREFMFCLKYEMLFWKKCF